MKTAKRRIRWGRRAAMLLVYDIVAINVAAFFGVWMRFDFSFARIPAEYWNHFRDNAVINTI